jgi:hypothetical protein
MSISKIGEQIKEEGKVKGTRHTCIARTGESRNAKKFGWKPLKERSLGEPMRQLEKNNRVYLMEY